MSWHPTITQAMAREHQIDLRAASCRRRRIPAGIRRRLWR